MVYILKLSAPLGNSKHQAQYYVGWTKDEITLPKRIACHQSGHGAAFTKAAVEMGITFEVILTLPGDKSVERQIKNQKNTARFVERYTRRMVRQGAQS